MESNVKDVVRKLAERYGYLFYIVASSDGNFIETGGDPASLKWRGLVNSLFGDSAAIARLNSSLEGQVLPQSWAQGETYCLVFKPRHDLIIGLCGHGKRNAVERYR